MVFRNRLQSGRLFDNRGRIMKSGFGFGDIMTFCVMIDIEALSLRPNAQIVSIGVVCFGSERIFNIKNTSDNYDQDKGVISWWSKRENADYWLEENENLYNNTKDALVALNKYIEVEFDKLIKDFDPDTENPRGWWDNIKWVSKGSLYDFPILQNAYNTEGVAVPFTNYKNILCLRSILEMVNEFFRTEDSRRKTYNSFVNKKGREVDLLQEMSKVKFPSMQKRSSVYYRLDNYFLGEASTYPSHNALEDAIQQQQLLYDCLMFLEWVNK